MRAFTIQSIRISKDVPLAEAKKIVRKMGYRVSGISPNPQYKNFHAFRQKQPKEFKPKTFRTQYINKNTLVVYGELK